MALLEYLDKDIDDGQFMDMLIEELYTKLYRHILADFRHRGDCTICHATLIGNKGKPVSSVGTESEITSPESIKKLSETELSDFKFNAEFKVAKTTAKAKIK